eukprot:363920-Chlamydomonas_euryale.AAC.3
MPWLRPAPPAPRRPPPFPFHAPEAVLLLVLMRRAAATAAAAASAHPLHESTAPGRRALHDAMRDPPQRARGVGPTAKRGGARRLQRARRQPHAAACAAHVRLCERDSGQAGSGCGGVGPRYAAAGPPSTHTRPVLLAPTRFCNHHVAAGPPSTHTVCNHQSAYQSAPDNQREIIRAHQTTRGNNQSAPDHQREIIKAHPHSLPFWPPPPPPHTHISPSMGLATCCGRADSSLEDPSLQRGLHVWGALCLRCGRCGGGG